MIKVENVDVWGIEHAIRGMRNPMNSWSKSDSEPAFHYLENFSKDDVMAEKYRKWNKEYGVNIKIGERDLDLMRRLCRAGTEHRKYLRQIFVSMDITAPTYWMAEFDTYKVGVTRNSCSFMHKGTSKPFEISDFSVDDKRVYEILSPIEKVNYPLVYAYETNEYRKYTAKNGRMYRVYKNGRVFAEKFEYTDTLNRHRVFEEAECSPSKTINGYYEIGLGGRSGEKWQLHRLVAALWIDNPDCFKTVNHIDGNKGNNCVENLEWCDLKENIQKGFDSGLYNNGKSLHAKYQKWKNGHRVVDPYVKNEILIDHNRFGLTGSEVAKKYDISLSQANGIIFGSTTENQDLFMICYAWETIIDVLNELREEYLETKDSSVFRTIRQLLPSGYNQRSTITMNYENAISMIKQRANHKLTEWREFVTILKELPYIKEITESEDEK